MPTYAQHLNAHLSRYKAKHLGALKPGTFMYRGEELQYDHVLPKEQQWLNILEPFRPDIQRYLRDRPAIKLHRSFHHLNSSQAFALNLFFPYFEKGGASQLLAAMGSTGNLSSWEPECIVDISEGTNVDVTWQSGSQRTYCEVKLSEQEFGSAQNDEAHRDKLERIYKPSLAGACAPELLQPEYFFQNYQLFCNVWLIAREPGSQLVFFVPRTNTKIWRQLASFLGLLASPLAARVRAVAVEDAISSLARAENLPSSLDTYAEFLREKYVLPAAA
jgi:hypothetical protein